jgi:hypothetical protein
MKGKRFEKTIKEGGKGRISEPGGKPFLLQQSFRICRMVRNEVGGLY